MGSCRVFWGGFHDFAGQPGKEFERGGEHPERRTEKTGLLDWDDITARRGFGGGLRRGKTLAYEERSGSRWPTEQLKASVSASGAGCWQAWCAAFSGGASGKAVGWQS